MVQLNKTCLTQAISLDSKEVQSKQQVYFKYLLWATFGLSAIRFIGVSSFFPLPKRILKLIGSVCTTGPLDSLVECGGGTNREVEGQGNHDIIKFTFTYHEYTSFTQIREEGRGGCVRGRESWKMGIQVVMYIYEARGVYSLSDPPAKIS